MAVGTIDKSVLTDIANATRVQNGGTDTYLPSEMAAVVLALDSTRAGTPYQASATSGTGVISDSIFDGIANAIRAQNGLAETYTPAEMAPAILALSWDVSVKIRALLLADGTLEFNYRDGRSSDAPGAIILKAWEVDPAGYSSVGSRPWNDDKLSVTRAVIDEDMEESGLESAAYLFHGCENLVEVTGFGHLVTVTNMNQMFVSCGSLETIRADNFYAHIESGTLMFSGCRRLVGERGYVPEQTDDHLNLHFEMTGVLTHTDGSEDEREWFRCFLYDDGELVLTAAMEPRGRAGARVVGAPVCERAVQLGGLPALVRPPARRGEGDRYCGHGNLQPREHELLALRASGCHRGHGHGEPPRRVRDAARLQQLRWAHRNRPLLARGPDVHLRRVRVARDDLGRRRLGATDLRRLWLPDVLPVRVARGRGGHDLRELARGLPVHEDRRRGRCRVPHGEVDTYDPHVRCVGRAGLKRWEFGPLPLLCNRFNNFHDFGPVLFNELNSTVLDKQDNTRPGGCYRCAHFSAGLFDNGSVVVA